MKRSTCKMTKNESKKMKMMIVMMELIVITSEIKKEEKKKTVENVIEHKSKSFVFSFFTEKSKEGESVGTGSAYKK